MSEEYPVHRTVTRKKQEAEGGGFEFGCADCGYRVVYIETNNSSIGPLVHILNAGAPGVWHTSSLMITGQSTGAADALPDDRILLEDDIVSDTWVTPEISAFLERILGRLD